MSPSEPSTSTTSSLSTEEASAVVLDPVLQAVDRARSLTRESSSELAQGETTASSTISSSSSISMVIEDDSASPTLLVVHRSPPGKIYGRLPKFSPFIGTFQHAPSAGNRARSSFFEQHLMSEEEHERRKRIKTNPFTGTFHYFPGRYSSLHGLQRFRHHAGFLTSFDELDQLAALGRTVTQKVKESDNPSLAAVFMNGIFTTPANQVRSSLYPHRTKAGIALYQELVLTGGAVRFRYGGAVDTSRKFGSSLDDSSLALNRSSSKFGEILYRWNGFRIFHHRKVRVKTGEHQMLRHRRSDGAPSMVTDISFSGRMNRSRSMRADSSSSLQSMAGGESFTATMHAFSSSSSSVVNLSRVNSLPGNMMDIDEGFHNQAAAAGTPLMGYRSIRERSPVRGLDVLSGGSSSEADGGYSYYDNASDNGSPTNAAAGSNGHMAVSDGISRPPPWAGRSLAAAGTAGVSTHGRKKSTGAGGTGTGGGVASVLRAPTPSPKANGQTSTTTTTTAAALPVVREDSSGGHDPASRKKKVGDIYDVDQADILGQGSYAAVYGAVHRVTGELRAVKAIKRRYLFSEDEKASVKNEIESMRRLPRHRNIIRLVETFETAEHIYLVLERSTHGNLEQILQLRRKLTELETMWVIKQLLDAVEVMHHSGVLHCDIKPQNLLFSDVKTDSLSVKAQQARRLWMYTSPLGMILKVCDFGLSRKVPDVRYFKHTGDIYRVPFSRICGTCGFIPPEIIQKQSFGKPTDMWSVGVVCYQMLSGSLPFIPPTKCLEQPVSFRARVWETISKDAQDFISKLLITDQGKRATVKDALGHRWLQTVPEWAPGLLKYGNSNNSSSSITTTTTKESSSSSSVSDDFNEVRR